MIDIIGVTNDLDLLSTEAPRAANILSVQLGSLEYAQTIGIDLKFFLSEDFTFQNESFKNYCVQVLANNGLNVAKVTETVSNLFTTFDFNLKASEQSDGLIAR